jgi:ribosomal subunit interface protein
VSTVHQADLVKARNGEAEIVPSDDVSGAEAQRADVVVKGRNVEVPDHFKIHVSGKLSRVERFHPTVYLFDVELQHERNRRQSKVCQRIEITARGKGHVIRAEASAESFYAALELAVDKLEGRFRRDRDRRKVHHGTRTPVSVAEATAAFVAEPSAPTNATDSAPTANAAWWDAPASAASALNGHESRGPAAAEGVSADYEGPGHVVRTKVHSTEPMTVDAALYEMELVGHDFYLFHDSATDSPSVVYRRRAYDYGLIRLG